MENMLRTARASIAKTSGKDLAWFVALVLAASLGLGSGAVPSTPHASCCEIPVQRYFSPGATNAAFNDSLGFAPISDPQGESSPPALPLHQELPRWVF